MFGMRPNQSQRDARLSPGGGFEGRYAGQSTTEADDGASTTVSQFAY